METFGQKQERVHRRCADLDAIRSTRLLTLDEVTEYFTLLEELGGGEVPSSDEEYGLDPTQTKRRVSLTPEDIPAWTGARFCHKTQKVELIPPPRGGHGDKDFITWRTHKDPLPWRVAQKHFKASLHLPYAYKCNYLDDPKHHWQTRIAEPEHLTRGRNPQQRSKSGGAPRRADTWYQGWTWSPWSPQRWAEEPRRWEREDRERERQVATLTEEYEKVRDAVLAADPHSVVAPPHFERYKSEAAGPRPKPKEPAGPPPAHLLARRVSEDNPPSEESVPRSVFRTNILRPPSPPKRELKATPKTTRHPVTKAYALDREVSITFRTEVPSDKALKRSWSRSRLNPRPGREEEVTVVDQPDWSPTTPTSVVETVTPSAEPAIPIAPQPKALPATSSTDNPWGNLRIPPTVRIPRLRVGLDYHNVIHEEIRRYGQVHFSGIPLDHVDLIRKLSLNHEVYILSWAPSLWRQREVEEALEEAGIIDIIGGRRRLYVGKDIPAKVSEQKYDKDGNPYWAKGKAKVAQGLGIHVLVDDSPDIGDEAVRLGVGFIGIQLPWMRQRHSHLHVPSLKEAVKLILEDPAQWLR
jgi:hypothetical protein